MTIEELMDSTISRVPAPTCTIFEAVAGVLNIVVNRLLLKRSDLVQDDLLLYFSTGDSSVPLPREFFSVSDLPRLSGGGSLLPVDPASKTLTSLQTPGTPKYYEQKNKTLYLYPPTNSDGSVIVPAYARPHAPDDLADDLPFYGAFDNVFTEGVVAVLSGGIGTIGDRSFAVVIESQVDLVLAAKSMSDEQALADSINYGR